MFAIVGDYCRSQESPSNHCSNCTVVEYVVIAEAKSPREITVLTVLLLNMWLLQRPRIPEKLYSYMLLVSAVR